MFFISEQSVVNPEIFYATNDRVIYAIVGHINHFLRKKTFSA